MAVCTDHLFKVLVVGDVRVGKTSVVLRSVRKSFSENYKTTIGVDFALKTVQRDPRTVVRLQLWDIAGQEQTRNLSRVFYREARGALVVFDAHNWPTLDSAARWKSDLDAKVSLDSGRPIPALLLANKCDLMEQRDRDAMAPSLDHFCLLHGFSGWFETSAKEGTNIEEAGSLLVEQMMTDSSDGLQQNKDVIKPGQRSGRSIASPCCWGGAR
ncbi:ras-related protein Rab-32-like [Eucyclogobius newberryi]|uniref:ras-related protein Rab-32-like n=1 Tax=Eucyclogobius newberryi TaxID=166745 RepID=UPI003B5A9550